MTWSTSRSTQGHHLYILCRLCVPDAPCYVSRSSDFWFWRRLFFKIHHIRGVARFTWPGHLYKLSFPFPWRRNVALIYQAVLEKIFEKGGWRMDGRQRIPILWVHLVSITVRWAKTSAWNVFKSWSFYSFTENDSSAVARFIITCLRGFRSSKTQINLLARILNISI